MAGNRPPNQVASLRFGVVEIVVHDSRVTQIEKDRAIAAG